MSFIKEDGNGERVTTYDVAERCGVSQATVSRALRNVKGRLSPETRNRILAVAREMGYDPMISYAARQLVSQRHGHRSLSYLIGFFFDHAGFAQSNYFTNLHRGIMSAIAGTGFEVVTSDTPGNVESPSRELAPVYRRGEIDGVLAISSFLRDGLTELLHATSGFGDGPIVGIIGPSQGGSVVRPDDYSAGYKAVSHLLELGHRDVMIVRWHDADERSIEGLRMRGYVDACKDEGLEPGRCLVNPNTNFKPHDVAMKMLARQIKDQGMTAIIAPNDLMAESIYSALTEAGIAVPEDASLISFDDTEVIPDGRGNNLLTTIRLPLFDIGEEGARMLLQRISGEAKQDRELVLPVELIVRGSTAPPRRLNR